MSAFRADIQALRAIAVLLVLAFHVWPSRVTGGYVGVDVFFVISGYLITGHLLREAACTGRIDLPAFYARRARRLLPAASLTLMAVGTGTYLWMPPSTWTTAAADMAASALYVENWALVRRSVDYLAQGQTPSPLQHFWSLAVEEQFYLGWPLMMVVATSAAAARTRRAGAKPDTLFGLAPPLFPRQAYALPMGALCGLSFAASLYYAHANPAAGYFMTHTRLHELGLGGLLAVWAVLTPAGPHACVKLGKPAAKTLASPWPRTLCAATGLAAIGGSGCMYTTDTPFPGMAALVPVLGAAAVIAAGEDVNSCDSTPVHALIPALAHPWLQYVGDVSYSLYLAHWPVVVMYPFITGRAVGGVFADGVTVFVLSFALAHMCKRGWEDRFRRGGGGGGAGKSLPRAGELIRASFLTIGMTAVVAAVSFTLHQRAMYLAADASVGSVLPQARSPPAANVSPLAESPRHEDGPELSGHPHCACPGLVGLQGSADASGSFPGADVAMYGWPIKNSLPIAKARPSVGMASEDAPWVFKKSSCAIRHEGDAELTPCEAEPPENAASGPGQRPRVVLIGDSHAAHWVPAFDAASHRMAFLFTSFVKAGCPPTAALAAGKTAPNLVCQEWVGKVVDWILREKPAAVVLSSYDHRPASSKDGSNPSELVDGTVRIARQMTTANIPVLGIKATPTMNAIIPECLAMAEARDPGTRDVASCSSPRATALAHPNNPVSEAAALYPIMRLLSFDDILCPNQTCPPMIGNVIVYRDRHHFTATFSASLASALQRRLEVAAPHLVQPSQ